MDRRSTAIGLVVVLLLVAGCAGAPDEATPASDRSADPSGSAAATPQPTLADPVYDLPLDGETVASAHNASLRAGGSFTAETNVTIVDASSDEEVTVLATTAVDLERGSVLVRGSTGQLTGQEVYVAPDGTAYRRVETASGEAEYEELAEAPDVTGYYELPVASFVEAATFTYAGPGRVAGTPVAVYEVTDPEALVAPGQVSTVDAGRLTAFEVRMAISADGVIRRFSYRVETEFDGSSRTIATTIVFRDVGTTTVEPPDWLDAAT